MNCFQLKEYKHVFEWIANCIICEVSEDAYRGLLTAKPFIYKYLIRYFCLSTNVPESEYPKIHATLRRHLPENEEGLEFYSLLNDIRFGDLTVLPLPLECYEKANRILLAQTAVLGNKRDIFLQIYDLMNGELLNLFLLMENVDGKCLQAKCFKVIFEIFAGFDCDSKWTNTNFQFIMKFYAIKGISRVDNGFVFELIAPDYLLDLGFSPVLRVNRMEIGYFYTDSIIFPHLRVVEVDTVLCFMSHCLEHAKINEHNKHVRASKELFEFIASSPEILEIFISAGIKIRLRWTDEGFINFFDLPNYEQAIKIVGDFYFENEWLTLLKKADNFRVIENHENKSIAEHFLEWEKCLEGSEFEYFEWRPLLIYLMRSGQGNKIREIKSPVMIEMLKLEFPEEMKAILTVN